MITKEYIFECILKGCPIEITESSNGKMFHREFALLRELGVIVSINEQMGSKVTHPFRLYYGTTGFLIFEKGKVLPPRQRV